MASWCSETSQPRLPESERAAAGPIGTGYETDFGLSSLCR